MKFHGAVLVRRRSVVLVALYLVLGTTLASAQTVILRHVPPGSTLELVVDAKEAGTAKANAGGNATVTANSVSGQMDANVWLDTCDDTYRVFLVRPGAALAPAGACRRNQIAGLYLLQRITSIVIDSSNTGSLLIRQGRAYNEWLTDPRPQLARAGVGTEAGAAEDSSEPLPPLTGLTLFGGAGLGTSLDFESQSCGTLDCTRESPLQYGGGIGWWFNDFFGVEGRYGYLGKLTVAANPASYQFSTTREGGFLAFGGRAGFRKGRFRPFGRAGLNLNRSTVTTRETVGESTQTFAMRTRGWAPVFGGGVEIWLSPRLGLYVDGQHLGLKGKDDRDSGIEVDDTLLTAQAGLTIRFP
jgi:hypothetical protein